MEDLKRKIEWILDEAFNRGWQQGRNNVKPLIDEIHDNVYQEGEKKGRVDAIEEFADNMQLVKLEGCDDIPRELIEAIEKQIGICALRVKELMLKERNK